LADVVNTTLRYNADLTSAMAQVKSLTAEVSALNLSFNALDKSAIKLRTDLATTFAANLGSIGGFSSQIVDLTTSTEKFGRAIRDNKLSMRENFSEAFRGLTRQKSLMRELAQEQVRYQNSQTIALGRNSNGRASGMTLIPNSVDFSNAENRMKKVNQEFAIFRKLVDNGANSLVNMGKQTQWTGRQLTVGLTMPVLLFGATFAKTFMDIDRELTRFAKVYGQDAVNTTTAGTAAMKQQVLDLAKTISTQFGVAAKDTVALAADIAATGQEGQNLIGSVVQTNRLAVLGEVDRQEAMKATLALQTAFKINTNDLADSINFLNAIENQTSTTLTDLVEAIPRVGPVIKGLGGDVKDLSVLLVAMKEGGVPAAEAANALKSGLAALINPSQKASDVAKEFGINLKGIVDANQGKLMPTLFALQGALDNLDQFSKSKVIEQIFGKYQFARISALFSNLGKAGSQTEQAMKLAGASTADLAQIANKELTTYAESTTIKFQRMVETVKNQLIPMGSALLEMLTPALDKVSGIIDFMSNALKNMPGFLKEPLKLLAGFALAAGPILMLLGLFKQLIGNGIKFGMSIVTLGAKLAGIKTDKFKLLDAETAGATTGLNALTTAASNQKVSFEGLNQELKLYITQLASIKGQSPAMFTPPVGRTSTPRRYASGGMTPGFGNSDTVPALLTPGEFVVRKSAAQKYKNILEAMNSGTLQGFATPREVTRRRGSNPASNPNRARSLQGGRSFLVSPFTVFASGDSPGSRFGMSQDTFMSGDEFPTQFSRSLATGAVVDRAFASGTALPNLPAGGNATSLQIDELAIKLKPHAERIVQRAREIAAEMDASEAGSANIRTIMQRLKPEIEQIDFEGVGIESKYLKSAVRKLTNATEEDLITGGYARTDAVKELTRDGKLGSVSRYRVSGQQMDPVKELMLATDPTSVIGKQTRASTFQRYMERFRPSKAYTGVHLGEYSIPGPELPFVGGARVDPQLESRIKTKIEEKVLKETQAATRAIEEGAVRGVTAGTKDSIDAHSASREAERRLRPVGEDFGDGALIGFQRGLSEGMQKRFNDTGLSAGRKMAGNIVSPVGLGLESVSTDAKITRLEQSILKFKEKQHTFMANRVRAESELSFLASEQVRIDRLFRSGQIGGIEQQNLLRDIARRRIVEQKALEDAEKIELGYQENIDNLDRQLIGVKERRLEQERLLAAGVRQPVFLGMPGIISGGSGGRGTGYGSGTADAPDGQPERSGNRGRFGGRIGIASMGLFGVSAMLSTVGSMNQSFGEATSGLNNFVFALSSAMMVLEMISSMKGMLGAGAAGGEVAGAMGASRFLALGPALLNPWVLGGVAAAAAIAGIAFAIYKMQSAAEDARKSSISMFKDPIESAKIFGTEIKSVQTAINDARQEAVLFKEDQKAALEIDPALTDAVKKDYTDFIDRLKNESAAYAGYELSTAFNDMLIKGLDASIAKKIIMAIAKEAGQTAAISFMDNLGTDVPTAIQKQVQGALPSSSNQRVTGLTENLNKQGESAYATLDTLNKTLGQQFDIGSKDNLNIIGVVQLMSIAQGMAQVNQEVKIQFDLAQKQLTDFNQTQDDIAKEIAAGTTYAPERLNAVVKSLMTADRKYFNDVTIAFNALKDAYKNMPNVDLAPLQSQLKELYPDFEVAINSVTNLTDALILLQAISAGIDITQYMKDGKFDISAIAGATDLENKVKAASEELTNQLNIQNDVLTKNLETEMRLSNQKIKNFKEVSKAGLKAFDERTKQMDEGFAQEQDASQARVDNYNEEKDLISKSADAYVKSLERKSAAESFYAKQTKTGLDAIQKLASGDVFGFLEARDQMSADASTRAYDQTIQNVNDRKDAELSVIDEKIKGEQDYQKEQQKTHDTAMTNREIERGQLERHYSGLEKKLTSHARQIQQVLNLPVETVAQLDTKTKEFAGLKDISVYPVQAYEDQAAKLQLMLYYVNLMKTNNPLQAYTDTFGGATTSGPNGFPTGGFPTAPGGSVPMAPASVILGGKEYFLPTAGTPAESLGLPKVEVVQKAYGGQIEARSFRRRNGFIAGAGGPREDRVPAMLSNGEYVVKASSVAKYGRNKLEQINQGILHLAEGGDGEKQIPNIYSTSPKLFTTTLRDKLSGQTTNNMGIMSTSTNIQPMDPNAVGSSTDVVGWLRAGGWPDTFLKVGYAIAMRESGGVPGAISSGDWGLFQLNKPTFGKQPWWNETTLLDPVENARIAWQYVSQQGKNFLPWGMRVDDNGSYTHDWASYTNSDGSWIDDFNQESADYVIKYTKAYYDEFPGFAAGGYINPGKIPHFDDGTPPSISSHWWDTASLLTPKYNAQAVKNIMGIGMYESPVEKLNKILGPDIFGIRSFVPETPKPAGPIPYTPLDPLSLFIGNAAMGIFNDARLATAATAEYVGNIPSEFANTWGGAGVGMAANGSAPRGFSGNQVAPYAGTQIGANVMGMSPEEYGQISGLEKAMAIGMTAANVVPIPLGKVAGIIGKGVRNVKDIRGLRHVSMSPDLATSTIHPSEVGVANQRNFGPGTYFTNDGSLWSDTLPYVYKPKLSPKAWINAFFSQGFANKMDLGLTVSESLAVRSAKITDPKFQDAISKGFLGNKEGRVTTSWNTGVAGSGWGLKKISANGEKINIGSRLSDTYKRVTKPKLTVHAAGPGPDEGFLVSRIVRRYVEDAPEGIPFQVISPSGAIITVIKERVGPTNYGLFKIHQEGFDPLPKGNRRGQSPTGTGIAMYANETIEMLIPSTLVNESAAISAAIPQYKKDLIFRQMMEGAGASSKREIDLSGITDETIGRITDYEKRGIIEAEMSPQEWNRNGFSNWRQLWEERSAKQNLNDNIPQSTPMNLSSSRISSLTGTKNSRDIVAKDYMDMYGLTEEDMRKFFPMAYTNIDEATMDAFASALFKDGKVDPLLLMNANSPDDSIINIFSEFYNQKNKVMSRSKMTGYGNIVAGPQAMVRDIVQAKRLYGIYEELLASNSSHLKGINSFDDFVNKVENEGSIGGGATTGSGAETRTNKLNSEFVKLVNSMYAKNVYGLSDDDLIRLYRTETNPQKGGDRNILGYTSMHPQMAANLNFMLRRHQNPLYASDVKVSDLPQIIQTSGFADEFAQFIPSALSKEMPIRPHGFNRNSGGRFFNPTNALYPNKITQAMLDDPLIKQRLIDFMGENNIRGMITRGDIFKRGQNRAGRTYSLNIDKLGGRASPDEIKLIRFMQDELGIPLIQVKTGRGLDPFKLAMGGYINPGKIPHYDDGTPSSISSQAVKNMIGTGMYYGYNTYGNSSNPLDSIVNFGTRLSNYAVQNPLPPKPQYVPKYPWGKPMEATGNINDMLTSIPISIFNDARLAAAATAEYVGNIPSEFANTWGGAGVGMAANGSAPRGFSGNQVAPYAGTQIGANVMGMSPEEYGQISGLEKAMAVGMTAANFIPIPLGKVAGIIGRTVLSGGKGAIKGATSLGRATFSGIKRATKPRITVYASMNHLTKSQINSHVDNLVEALRTEHGIIADRSKIASRFEFDTTQDELTSSTERISALLMQMKEKGYPTELVTIFGDLANTPISKIIPSYKTVDELSQAMELDATTLYQNKILVDRALEKYNLMLPETKTQAQLIQQSSLEQERNKITNKFIELNNQTSGYKNPQDMTSDIAKQIADQQDAEAIVLGQYNLTPEDVLLMQLDDSNKYNQLIKEIENKKQEILNEARLKAEMVREEAFAKYINDFKGINSIPDFTVIAKNTDPELIALQNSMRLSKDPDVLSRLQDQYLAKISEVDALADDPSMRGKQFRETLTNTWFRELNAMKNMLPGTVDDLTRLFDSPSFGEGLGGRPPEDFSFAMGGLLNRKNYRQGSLVSGSGTSMSDSIPAMLSNGEYVVRASSVDKYGTGFMDKLNQGVLKMAGGGYVNASAQMPRYNIPSAQAIAPSSTNVYNGGTTLATVNVYDSGNAKATAYEVANILNNMASRTNHKAGVRV
jgi:TP901 family phage tail tape measure protein